MKYIKIMLVMALVASNPISAQTLHKNKVVNIKSIAGTTAVIAGGCLIYFGKQLLTKSVDKSADPAEKLTNVRNLSKTVRDFLGFSAVSLGTILIAFGAHKFNALANLVKNSGL